MAESVSEFFFKSVNIWHSYKQERGCLMHFVRLTNTLLKTGKSAVISICDIGSRERLLGDYALCQTSVLAVT